MPANQLLPRRIALHGRQLPRQMRGIGLPSDPFPAQETGVGQGLQQLDGAAVVNDALADRIARAAGLDTRLARSEVAKLALYLDNDEARETLYEDGLAFRTDYPVDDKIIGDKLKKASTVIDVMRRRRAEEARAAG